MSVVLERVSETNKQFFYRLGLKCYPIEQIVIFNQKERFTIGRGWLEIECHGHKREIKKIEFEKLTKKRKIDFSINESFLANFPDQNGDEVLTLFLYALDLKTEVKKAFNKDSKVVFYKYLKFTFNDLPIVVSLFDHEEKMEKAEILEKELKELNIKINSFDLVRMLKIYDIIKK